MASKSLPLAADISALTNSAKNAAKQVDIKRFHNILEESTKRISDIIYETAKKGTNYIFIDIGIHQSAPDTNYFPIGYRFNDLLNCLQDRLKENGYTCTRESGGMKITW